MKHLLLLLCVASLTTPLQAQTSHRAVHKKTSSKSQGTKYVYIEVITVEPEVNIDRNSPFFGQYSPKVKTYVSEIVTINNYNEDKKYMLLDRVVDAKKQIFSTNNIGASQDRTCSVVGSDAYVFNSYREASIARSTKQ